MKEKYRRHKADPVLAQNHCTFSFERDLWGLPCQSPIQGKINKNRLLRASSKWAFNISKVRGPATTLGNLFQCLMPLMVTSFCLLCRQIFPYYNLGLGLLDFLQHSLEKSQAMSDHNPPLGSWRPQQNPPFAFWSWYWTASALTAHPHRPCAPVPNHLGGLHQTRSIACTSLTKRGGQLMIFTCWLHTCYNHYKVAIFTTRAHTHWPLTDFS